MKSCPTRHTPVYIVPKVLEFQTYMYEASSRHSHMFGKQNGNSSQKKLLSSKEDLFKPSRQVKTRARIRDKGKDIDRYSSALHLIQI